MRRIYSHVLSAMLCNTDMEQTGTVSASDEAATALVAAKKPRKPSVDAATFVTALNEASKRETKPTAAELAEELGMEKGSFDQRLNQLRNEWKEMVAEKHPKAVNEDGSAKPFPFALADGRKSDGTGVSVGKSAILAALAAIG